MRKELKSISLIVLVVLLSSCLNTNQNSDDKIITVSILPQKFFIQELIGDKLIVNVMIPTGASPASYEPTPRQMAQLSQSDLYLRIGYIGFEEAWMPRFQRSYPEMKIIDLSAGIHLLGGEEEDDDKHGHDHDHAHGIDPHIWMSPKQAKQIVKNTANALVKYDEASKNLVIHNRDSLLNVIDELDKQFSNALEPIQNRKFIIFHPALTYLANDYQMEQIAMELKGKEPSPAYFKSIVDRAKDENIALLFIQKEFDIENARQMAHEVGAELIQIDPLAENWYSQMVDILEKLKKLN